MALPVSNDLRERIVASQKEGLSYEEIAARLGVGRATVSRVLRRHRERGDVTPDRHGGGMPAKIADEELDELRAVVASHADRTVEQLRHVWAAHRGTVVSRSAMQRSLHRAGLTWKKNDSGRSNSSGPT